MQCKILFYLTLIALLSCCTSAVEEDQKRVVDDSYESGYEDFVDLAIELKQIRNERLIDLNQFLEMQKDSNTIVLDSRSADLFINKHLKGALNLPFTEYTQQNLTRIIPDRNTRILIYCNNNFTGDVVNFASKKFRPNKSNQEILKKRKPILLALNIPTFVTLHGYGYENVYELSEVINVRDFRLEFTEKRARFVSLKEITIKEKRK